MMIVIMLILLIMMTMMVIMLIVPFSDNGAVLAQYVIWGSAEYSVVFVAINRVA